MTTLKEQLEAQANQLLRDLQAGFSTLSPEQKDAMLTELQRLDREIDAAKPIQVKKEGDQYVAWGQGFGGYGQTPEEALADREAGIKAFDAAFPQEDK